MDMHMDSFLLAAYLRTPFLIRPDTWLTLDSLLSAALERTRGRWRAEDIPLARIGDLFLGSAAFPVEPQPYQGTLIAAMQAHFGDFDADPRRKVLRTGGEDKPDIDRYGGWEVRQVVWFGRGDAEACRSLIAQLPGIGKRAAHGYGEIERVEVIPLSVDRSLVLPDGTPARPVPRGLWDALAGAGEGIRATADLPQDMTGFRPDYWTPANRALCVVPVHANIGQGQLARIEEGVTAASPTTLPPLEKDTTSAIAFFAQHLGRRLAAAEGVEGRRDKTAARCAACGSREDLQRSGSGYTTLCGTCFTFAGGYRHIVRPGRMGAGWMGLVTPASARLVTSVPYKDGVRPFAEIEGVHVEYGKPALAAFLGDVLLDPPVPPYLLFVSGNSSVNVLRGLAITWSNRRVKISGNDPAIVDAIALREHFQAWQATGVSATALNKAMTLREQVHYAHDPRAREQAEHELAKLLKKQPIEDLLKSLPGRHTGTWQYLLRLINAHDKARRSPA